MCFDFVRKYKTSDRQKAPSSFGFLSTHLKGEKLDRKKIYFFEFLEIDIKSLFQILPQLDRRAVFITDEELGFRIAIAVAFPNAMVLRSWRHLGTNLDHWLKKHNG